MEKKSLEGFTRIKLEKELAYTVEKGKKVLVKDERGENRAIRDDLMGLTGLLGRLDSKLHSMKDYKQWLKIRDKLRDCFYNSLDYLDLSLDEASFLKNYLTELTTNDAKDVSLAEFEIRSLVGILEQFEEK